MKNYLILIVVGVLLVAGLLFVRSKNAPKESADSTPSGTTSQTSSGSDGAPSVSQPEGSNQISVTVTSPSTNATVSNSSLTVTGKTVPNAEVFVNEAETVADSKGNFSAKLTLDEGENYIIVFANDAEGNVAEKEITVNYDSGE